MAQKTSSTYSIIAVLTAVLLLGAAGVVYLQSSSGSGGGNSAALAALSQALPQHAADAASGAPRGFNQLDNDVKRLASLASDAGMRLPGNRAQWQALQQSAKAV
jgi:hypothetical protein